MSTEPEVLPPQQTPTSNGAPKAGVTERDETFAIERRRSAEMATSAMSTSARAEIESRYVVAIQRPRDMLRVRQRLLSECQRPGFAESAWYAKPIGGGKKARGPSIRFAEAFMRLYGNLESKVSTLYDDDERRVLRVTVIDYETNYSPSREITLLKRVERSRPRAGLKIFGQRINSEGSPVFIVEATEDDFGTKEAAIVSKTLREVALRHLAGDLREECEVAIKQTLAGDPKETIEAKRKKMVDRFGEVSVSADMLANYLGHPVDQTTPDEIIDLREVFSALRDGETTWREVIEAQRSGAEKPKDPAEDAARSEAMRAKAKAAMQKPEPAKEPEPKPEPETRVERDPAAMSDVDIESELDDLRAAYMAAYQADQDGARSRWNDAIPSLKGRRDKSTILRRARDIVADAVADAKKE